MTSGIPSQPATTGSYLIDYTGIGGGELNDSFRASVWDGCPGSGGTELFCHRPCEGPAIVQLTASTTYYIRIAGVYSATGIYSLTVHPAPVADECANAVALQKDTESFGTTQEATTSTTSSCDIGDIYDVWYSYTALEDETIGLLVEDFNWNGTTLSVFDGCPSTGNELLCVENGGEGGQGGPTPISLTTGQTIYIRVALQWESTGVFKITVSSLPDPPAFSDCANAVTVSLNVPYSDTNEGALTTQGMDNYCGGYHDVWHTFTPAVSGDYAIEAMGQETGCIITVFDACNGNFVDCGWGMVNVSLTEAMAYKIAVAGELTDTYEAYTLTVTEDSGGGE